MRDSGSHPLTSSAAIKDFLRARLGVSPYEVFAPAHLNANHAVIDHVEMFRSTVSQTSVYPRDVIKEALALNSSAILLVHSHPSGNAEPGRADEMLNQSIKAACALVDVRVVNHLSSPAGTSSPWRNVALVPDGGGDPFCLLDGLNKVRHHYLSASVRLRAHSSQVQITAYLANKRYVHGACTSANPGNSA